MAVCPQIDTLKVKRLGQKKPRRFHPRGPRNLAGTEPSHSTTLPNKVFKYDHNYQTQDRFKVRKKRQLLASNVAQYYLGVADLFGKFRSPVGGLPLRHYIKKALSLNKLRGFFVSGVLSRATTAAVPGWSAIVYRACGRLPFAQSGSPDKSSLPSTRVPAKTIARVVRSGLRLRICCSSCRGKTSK